MEYLPRKVITRYLTSLGGRYAEMFDVAGGELPVRVAS